MNDYTSDDYRDIIDKERPVSSKHPRMPIGNRAAQFAPFAALTGLDDAIKDKEHEHTSGIDGSS
ncbi:MAG: hypothetical protein K6F34_11340 [Lachnospiraceae bacterium]|nr:hypothetical protein [Lachnospiraceae bacterium]